MNITKKDVGRSCINRKGDTVNIIDFVDCNDFPVITDYAGESVHERSHLTNGQVWSSHNCDRDLIAFVDEEKTENKKSIEILINDIEGCLALLRNKEFVAMIKKNTEMRESYLDELKEIVYLVNEFIYY